MTAKKPTHRKTSEPRRRSSPEAEHSFLPHHPRRAVEAIAILGSSVEALHASFDVVQRHRRIYRDDSGAGSRAEGLHGRESFVGTLAILKELLESIVRGETDRAVGALFHDLRRGRGVSDDTHGIRSILD